jgi:hypothetical protein
MIGQGAGLLQDKSGFRVFSDKPPWLAATTNYENLNPANPVGL